LTGSYFGQRKRSAIAIFSDLTHVNFDGLVEIAIGAENVPLPSPSDRRQRTAHAVSLIRETNIRI
jgi:hypothetical protein